MPDHSAISRCSDSRPWVLIDSIARTGYCSNGTTAYTSSSRRFPVRVSFELADPPGVSLCFVHCPGPRKWDFNGDPLILTASQAFVLLVVSFRGRGKGNSDEFDDYFVYRAGPGNPRLDRICMPSPRDYDDKTIGILPLCDGMSIHYAVVVPLRRYNRASHRVNYSLRVLRSDRGVWDTKETLMATDSETDCCKVLDFAGTGVMSFGGGILGWVDLWCGILLCNVLDEKPMLRLVQWPVAEPCSDLNHISPRPFRDVAVINGMIKFVELKFHKPNFSQGVLINRGWTVSIWKRIVSSVDWHRSSKVHNHEISLVDSVLMSQMPFLVPEVLDVEAKSLIWDKVSCNSPTLSLNSDDDVVYIMVKAKLEHPIAFVFAVNAGDKTLEAVEYCRAEKMTCLAPTYVASAFSSYLGTNAGTAPAKVLERPCNVAGSNVENNVTAEPPLQMPDEQPKRTPVTASYTLPPAQKDAAKKTYASIVSHGLSTAVLKPKPVRKPAMIAIEGAGPPPELEHPYVVDGSNIESNVAVEPHLPVHNEQFKSTPVAASSSLPRDQNDVTEKTHALTYEEAMASLAQMEKRAIRAERLLEATLQHQSSQQKAVSQLQSPRTFVQDGSSQEFQPRRINLLEPLSPSWGDKNKGKQNSVVDCTEAKLAHNHDQSEETPNMDDEEQGETQNLESEWRLLIRNPWKGEKYPQRRARPRV